MDYFLPAAGFGWGRSRQPRAKLVSWTGAALFYTAGLAFWGGVGRAVYSDGGSRVFPHPSGVAPGNTPGFTFVYRAACAKCLMDAGVFWPAGSRLGLADFNSAYLYNCLARPVKEKYGLNTAIVSGDIEARSTLKLPQREKLDFNKVLTLFSPISKDKETIFPHIHDEIDVLIATDCISEGQNLQDCDYLINYDIHWNPVRIIQRFGRIDRIGSRNKVIQLVNYWPNVTLDDYIDLKGRVEARMKVSVLTSTGDDNPISPEEKGDLEYRREQLKRLQTEVVDIEEMNTGVSIMDLGLNEFRLDLLSYIKDNPDIEHSPFGLHAVVPATDENQPGVVYVLKNRNNSVNIDHKNRLHPFYMVYISEQKDIIINHLSPKELLDRMRHMCKGKDTPDMDVCRMFNRLTRDGKNMSQYSDLLRCHFFYNARKGRKRHRQFSQRC